MKPVYIYFVSYYCSENNRNHRTMVFRQIIFFAIIQFMTVQGLLGQQHILFNYSLDNGLPQSSILCMYQDATGNMWFGTQGGVCKYNGNSFRNFDTRHGLGDNHITAIFQDNHGKYWFGHRYKGLTTMHGNEFRHYDFIDQQITDIVQDSFGNMWIGTLDKGLYLLDHDFDPEHPNFKRLDMYFDLPPTDINDIIIGEEDQIIVGSWKGLSIFTAAETIDDISLNHFSTSNSILPFDEVISIAREPENIYWLYSYEGLAKIKIQSPQQIELIDYYPFNNNLKKSSMNKITVDKNGVLWGTWDMGIFKFSNDQYSFDFVGTGYHHTRTYGIYQDKENNLWIGTMDLGAFKFYDDKFMLFDQDSGLLNSVVTAVLKDRSGKIWIATEGGLCIYDGKNYKYYTDKDILPNNTINTLFEDSHGYIWIGNYYYDPLLRFDPRTGTFRRFNEKDGIPTNSVITINEDTEGNIWFASLWDTPFRYTYPKAGKPEKFREFTKSDGLCSNSIWIIHRDLKGNLWFGSDNAGLSKYDGHTFTTYNQQDGLTNLSCGALAHDSRNNLWIGSIGGGIIKFDGKRFTSYGITDGLSSDSPFSIICDDSDMIWVGTNTGIDRFDPVYKTFKHYGKSDGFYGIENNQNAVFKDDDGIIWFGTIHGLIRFDPGLDKPNAYPPVTVIENVNLFYDEFNYREFSDSIDEITGLPVGLKFNYKNNHLSFEYVGISHKTPEKIKYRYQLENFDKNWTPVTQKTSATYTNIPPGKYTFKVMATNNDGVWDSHPATLSFRIMPPVWQTAWFRLIVIVGVLGVIYLVFLWRLKRIKLQKAKLEKLVNKKTTELIREAEERKKAQLKAEESDKLKSSFLANMSHEIRTPVNAIVGFADLLKDNSQDEKEKELYLNYIIGGGKTLLNLINDIIDISKIEAGQIRISNDICNIGKLFSDLFLTFNEELKKRNKQHIEFTYNLSPDFENADIYGDPLRLKQVLSNLIGNAIKFTDKGQVEFGLSMDTRERITFYVKDTGIGIPAEKMDVIFQRFRQVEESYTRNFEGTGLGLAISKKLTELMGGEMWVESSQGKGSVFYFNLPYKPVKNNGAYKEPKNDLNGLKLSDLTILVVEDEQSNFLLVEKMFDQNENKLIHAADGNTAVKIFEQQSAQIDLVLMDIKIPGLNGYEATRAIKKIKPEVPVIAQTAYAVTGEKEKCLEAGCNDYIAKPYTKTELYRIIRQNIPVQKEVVVS